MEAWEKWIRELSQSLTESELRELWRKLIRAQTFSGAKHGTLSTIAAEMRTLSQWTEMSIKEKRRAREQ